MVEYIVNEIDKLTKTNNEKMKKLIELKSKSIKNSVYSNLNIPSSWKVNPVYKQVISELASTDEEFVKYQGNGKSNKLDIKKEVYFDNLGNKKEVVFKSNGRVDYKNYLRNFYPKEDDVNKFKKNLLLMNKPQKEGPIKIDRAFEEEISEITVVHENIDNINTENKDLANLFYSSGLMHKDERIKSSVNKAIKKIDDSVKRPQTSRPLLSSNKNLSVSTFSPGKKQSKDFLNAQIDYINSYDVDKLNFEKLVTSKPSVRNKLIECSKIIYLLRKIKRN